MAGTACSDDELRIAGWWLLHHGHSAAAVGPPRNPHPLASTLTPTPAPHTCAGWGFGGAPLGVAGLSAGGMCGVVAGLGWGVGFGMGTQYINVSPEFTEGKQHRCALCSFLALCLEGLWGKVLGTFRVCCSALHG